MGKDLELLEILIKIVPVIIHQKQMKRLLLILFLLSFCLSSKAQSSCPDNHHPHMIDLGLPSGTKWACCNVGASRPEEYGGYYAWGETEEKDYYT